MEDRNLQANLGWLFARLIRRLKITGGGRLSNLIQVSPVIQLVSQVDPLLESVEVEGFTTTITPGVGWYTIITVPEGEAWTLHRLDLRRLTGTYTFDSVVVYNKAGSWYCRLYDFTTTSTIDFSTVDVPLTGGMTIRLNVDVHSVDGDLLVVAYYTKKRSDFG